MPTIQGRTRKDLRRSIGYNLGAMRIGSATGTGTRTSDNVGTLIDLSLTTVIGGNDDHVGKWIVFTSGNNDGDIARVTDYSATSPDTTLTFQADAGVAIEHEIAAGTTYELWDMDYSPSMIHDMMNQAVIDATGHVYDPVENLDLHSNGRQLRFDIPSGLSMIQDIYYRDKVDSTTLLNLNDTFDESTTLITTTLNGAISDATATSVTVTSATTLRANQVIKVGSEEMSISSISSNTLTVSRGANSTTAATHSDGANVLIYPVTDTEDKKQGTASNKFIISASGGAGNIVTDSIASKDISKYDYLEGWVKITRSGEATTTAGDLQILLDDTASCASPLETLSLPALTDDTWTFFRVKLGNPELDTAIISIGLKYTTDLGACTIWLDDIMVVRNDSAHWEKVPRNIWKIDRESNDIVFDSYFKSLASYKLLKIVGGDKPALLNADSTSNEIDDQYIISYATGLCFASASGGPATDPEARRQQAAFWTGKAEQTKRAFPLLRNVRTI